MKVIQVDQDRTVTISDSVAAILIATRACSRLDTAHSRARDLATNALNEVAARNEARFSHQVADEVDDDRPEQTTYSRFALHAVRDGATVHIDFDVRRVDASKIDMAAILAADNAARSRGSRGPREHLHDEHFTRRRRS